MPGSHRLRRDIRLINKHMRREAYRWGQTVTWYEFDPTSVEDVDSDDPGTGFDDDLYDEGGVQARPGTTATGTSRKWQRPKTVQVYMARIDEGMEDYSEEGTYVVDRLTITTNTQLLRSFDIDPSADHMNDRIEFDGRLFNIQSFERHGWIADTNTTVTVMAPEVMDDERQTDDASWHA